MGRPLNEVLKDSNVLEELKRDPEGFSFKEAPSLIITMVSYPAYTALRMEDLNSDIVRAGIPTNFPIVGPSSQLLSILSSELNFTYKQIVPPDMSFGIRSANGTWSGMIRQVLHKEADIGLGPFQVIQSRAEIVDYTVPFFFDTLSLMAARGSASINPWGFLMPFTPNVWVGFFIGLLVISLTHFLIDCRDRSDSNFVSRLGYILFEYIQPPMGHALHRRDMQSWQRPLLGSWIILSLLFNASYDGTLRSLMALRVIPHPIQTLKDAVEASSRKIILEHRTSFKDIMGRVKFGYIRKLDDLGNAGRYVDLKMGDFMSYYPLVRDEGHIQIFDSTSMFMYFSDYFSKTGRCDFYIGKEKFIPIMYAMTLQKNNPVTPAFNARIRRLVEGGFYNYWVFSNRSNITACANPPQKVAFQDPIGLESIWGLFVIWASGLSLATAVLTLEICVSWLSMKLDDVNK